VDALMERSLAAMRDLGATLVDPVALDLKDLAGAELDVLLYEFKAGLNRYLERRTPRVAVGSLRELIAYNESHRDTVMPHFGQEHFLAAEEKGPLTDPAYLAALYRCRQAARDQGIDAAIRTERLDALVAPTAGPAYTIDQVNGDHYIGGSSMPAAVAGYPTITVPAGQVHGLPVGISFFAGAYAEAELVRIAYAFEQGTRARVPPGFAPTVGLP
jgi:amidase